MRAFTLLFCFYLFVPVFSFAQEENGQIITQGTHYLDLKIKAVDKYNARLEKQQQKLINKLKRKEQKLATKLKSTDSVAYSRYKQQNLSYDSIGHLMNADSATMAARTKSAKNPITDSLKGVEAFVQSKSGNSPQMQGYTSELTKQQTELNYHTYINSLITQRTNSLKSIAAQGDVPGFTGIEKQVFYGKAKMNVYKDMEEDPSKAEDKALEYLEGSEGFDQAMKGQAGGAGGMTAGASSASDLEKMGYQTKSQLQNSLQQKFGGNMGAITQQVSSQISQFQDKLNRVQSSINDAKQTKQSLQQLKNTSKPSFKINPERGKPFWKRLEKQYNWQTTRATADGQPAMLEASAMVGFKQTPKLVYGLGVASAMGLGQSWSNVQFSFQGVGLRSYTTWQWQYGVGTYVGYERMYKQAVFIKQPENVATDITPSAHNTTTYSESVLVGLTKSYKINSKYNGAIQLLYDIWWQQKGLSSPFLIRFSTITK